MKRCLVYFLLLVLHLNSHAQHSTVAPVFESVLIKGLPNRISVGLPGIAADSIIVTAHHSKIQKVDNWNWIVIPDTAFNTETIFVTALKKKKVVSSDSTIFRLKWVADPHVYISGIGSRDSVEKDVLANCLGLYAYGTNEDTDFPYVVISFAMIVYPYPPVHYSDDAHLTNHMKDAIQRAQPGDRAEFSQITVRYPDGRIKVVEDISVILK